MLHSNTGILLDERLDSNCENEEENDFTQNNVPDIFNQTSQVIGNLECQKEDLVHQLNKPGHDHALDKFMLTHLKQQSEQRKRNKKVQNVTPLLYLPSEKNPSVVTIDQVMFNSLTGTNNNRNKRKRSEKSQNSSQCRRKEVIEKPIPHFLNTNVPSPDHVTVIKEVETMGDNPCAEEMVECAVCKVKLENNVRLALHSKVHRRHINTGMRRGRNDIRGGNRRKTLNDVRLISENNTFSGVAVKSDSKSSGLNSKDELKNGNRKPEMTSFNSSTLFTGVNTSNLNFEQLSSIIRALAMQNVNVVSTIETSTASETNVNSSPVNVISVNDYHVKRSNLQKTYVDTLSLKSDALNKLGKTHMSNNEDDLETDINDCIPLSNSVEEPVNMKGRQLTINKTDISDCIPLSTSVAEPVKIQGRQLTINKTNTLLCLNSEQNLSSSPAKENVNSIYVAESVTKRDCMFKGPDSQNQSDDLDLRDLSLETTDLSRLRNSETCLKRDCTMLQKDNTLSKELDTVNLVLSRQELERNALIVLTKLSQQMSPRKGNNPCTSSNPKLKRRHARSNPEAQQSSDLLFKDSEYRGTTISDCNDSLNEKSGLTKGNMWSSTQKYSKMPTNISPCTAMVRFVKRIENLCNVRKMSQEKDHNLHIDKHLNAHDENEPTSKVHDETQTSSPRSNPFEDDLLLSTKYWGITLKVCDKFCSRTTCYNENMRNYRQWKRQFKGVKRSNIQRHNLHVDSCNTNSSDYCGTYSVMDENSNRSVNHIYMTDSHINVLNGEHTESCHGNTNIETSEHEMTDTGNIDEDENSSRHETNENAKLSTEGTQNAINMDSECFMKYRASASVLDDDSLIQCEKYRKLPLDHDDTVSSFVVSNNIEHSGSTPKVLNVHDQESTVEAVKHIESIQLNDSTGHSEVVGIQTHPTGNDIKGGNEIGEFEKGDSLNKSSVIKNLFNKFSRSFNTLDCSRSETNVYGQIMKSLQGETINNYLDDISEDEMDPSNMDSKSNRLKEYNENMINVVSGKCSRVCSIQENMEHIKCQKFGLVNHTNLKINKTLFDENTGIIADNSNEENGEKKDLKKTVVMDLKHETLNDETRRRKRQLFSKCSQNLGRKKGNVAKYCDVGKCETILRAKECNTNIVYADFELNREKVGTSNKQVHAEQIVNIGIRFSPRKRPLTKSGQVSLDNDFIRRSPRKRTVNKSSFNSQECLPTRRSPRKHQYTSKQSYTEKNGQFQMDGKDGSLSNYKQSVEKILPNKTNTRTGIKTSSRTGIKTSTRTGIPPTSCKQSVGNDSLNKTVKQRESASKCESKSVGCYLEKDILRKSSRKHICRNTCTLNCCLNEAEACCRKVVEINLKNKLHGTKNETTRKHRGKVGQFEQNIGEPRYRHSRSSLKKSRIKETISARKKVIIIKNKSLNLQKRICKEKLKVKMFGSAFKNRCISRSKVKGIENGSSKKCKKTICKKVNISPTIITKIIKRNKLEIKHNSKIGPLEKDTEEQFVRNLRDKFKTPEKPTDMTASSLKETKRSDESLLTTPKKRWRDLFQRQVCSKENTSSDLKTASSQKQTDKNIIYVNSTVTDLDLIDIQDREIPEIFISPTCEPMSGDKSSTCGSDDITSCEVDYAESGKDLNSTCARLIQLSKIRNSSRTLPIFFQLKK